MTNNVNKVARAKILFNLVIFDLWLLLPVMRLYGHLLWWQVAQHSQYWTDQVTLAFSHLKIENKIIRTKIKIQKNFCLPWTLWSKLSRCFWMNCSLRSFAVLVVKMDCVSWPRTCLTGPAKSVEVSMNLWKRTKQPWTRGSFGFTFNALFILCNINKGLPEKEMQNCQKSTFVRIFQITFSVVNLKWE